eukprot:2471588-Pyramimonas_sp.AAC.1
MDARERWPCASICRRRGTSGRPGGTSISLCSYPSGHGTFRRVSPLRLERELPVFLTPSRSFRLRPFAPHCGCPAVLLQPSGGFAPRRHAPAFPVSSAVGVLYRTIHHRSVGLG